MPGARAPTPPSNDASAVGSVILATEAALAVLAWIAGRWSGFDWAAMVRPTAEGAVLGPLGGVGLVALHLVLTVTGGRGNLLYRRIVVPLRGMLRPWVR